MPPGPDYLVFFGGAGLCMAAVVAHEVKNPLTGIRGAIQVIGGKWKPVILAHLKQGDPLVEIDKRPYQAALDQALDRGELAGLDQYLDRDLERSQVVDQGGEASAFKLGR